jgi:pSer/pThr/pTyr-binding forkhead associated (FHA) protein
LGIILEVKSGPFAGRKIPLRDGGSVLIGRAPERAQFAVPHDNQMSGVHFAVECGPKGCRVTDKGSTNGTHLNGAKIHEEMLLANGDEIRSGQTVFIVRMVPEGQLPPASSSPRTRDQGPVGVPPRDHAGAMQTPPQPPVAAIPKASPPGKPPSLLPSEPLALVIGSWAFHKIPNGWQIQEGLGIQQVVKDAFPSSIGAIEEPLGPGLTLQHYVDAHTKMFREHLRDPKISVTVPPVIRGSVETVALEIHYSPKEGPSIFFRRDYARCGSILGVLTLTTLEKDVPSIRPIYDSVLSTISFSHKEQA